ncbi:unnamed protein product [Bursaphelenchus xylophilus]|nr:unnamed protein product [Bursaphelenchus xylophilus]CAG9100467.1 unnamed protein product [Bursaphelenchus xylophilus]
MKFEEIKSQAEEFLRIHGPTLQNYAHLVSWTSNNYVTDLWEKYVYLSSREPLLINFSVGFADGWKVKKRSLARRAANHVNLLTAAAIAFYKEDVDPPGEGFCFTDRHNKVFTHSRIPQKDIDSYIDHGLTSHIVVQFNGCFYRVEVFDPQTRKLYQPAQLQAILDEIMNRDDVPSDVEKNLAALTADRRDKWAENREVFFLKNKVNLKFLNDIETALFFLILDPEDFGDVANDKDVTSHYIKVMTHGKGNDRWTDKPLNYHVTGCGRIGGTFEHGVCDGVEYRTFCEYVLYHESKYVIDNTDQLSESQRKTLKYAEKMEIEEIPGMKKETLRCYEEQVKRNADFDLASIMFQEFGKGEIKKCECSPDAFLQMAYQLAYYRLHSHFPLTYEASGSLFYNNGRTETIRTVSEESCEFINDVINGSPIHLRRKSLLKACREHVLRSKNALVGKGIDRHLFVLYAMSKYKNVKSEFLDTYIGQKWTLSTSQVPNLAQICDEDAHHDMCFMAGSFGAVDKDGYGITYRFMGNHSIALHVSSYHSSPQTDSKKMREAILDALREMASYFSMEQRHQEEVKSK